MIKEEEEVSRTNPHLLGSIFNCCDWLVCRFYKFMNGWLQFKKKKKDFNVPKSCRFIHTVVVQVNVRGIIISHIKSRLQTKKQRHFRTQKDKKHGPESPAESKPMDTKKTTKSENKNRGDKCRCISLSTEQTPRAGEITHA